MSSVRDYNLKFSNDVTVTNPSNGSSTFRSHLTLVKFRIGGCMNRAAEVGTSGVLCAVTAATLTLAVGWSVNPSQLSPACLCLHVLNMKDAVCGCGGF